MKIFGKMLFFWFLVILMLLFTGCQTIVNIAQEVFAELFEKVIFNVKVDVTGCIRVKLVDRTDDIVIDVRSPFYKKVLTFISDTKIKPVFHEGMLIYNLE